MSRVRIVGGGLTGVLAALEAHRLGARQIELHEHLDRLGGALMPRTVNGLELRERCDFFGDRSDPVRKLLEWHGAAFDDVEAPCGSLNPSPRGETLAVRGFAGPVLQTGDGGFSRLAGEALTDRLRAYPADFNAPLTRYCQWRLGVWLDEVHASAAGQLGIDQIRAADAPQDPAPPLALPRDGFTGLFAAARRALDNLGVTVHFNSLVSPREVIGPRDPETVTVWTPGPGPLFQAMNRPVPKTIAETVTSYVFQVRYGGPVPFMLQNFTADGSVFRISLYESRGETLLCAECVAETPEADLRAEIHQLMAPFDGASLKLGEGLATMVRTRWDYLSMDAVRKLTGLRSALAQARGPALVTAPWEAWNITDRFRKLARGLESALAEELPVAQAAA